MTLVFLLEEESMAAFLRGLLPRILPAHIAWVVIPQEGKQDLEKSIPRKLRGWRTPNTHFIIVRDQDAGDCLKIKERLRALCEKGTRPDTLVRIACKELEAYFLGDPEALADVAGDRKIIRRLRRARYRDPDSVTCPSAVTGKWAPQFGKVGLAREMGERIDVEGNRSSSFRQLLGGIGRLCQ